MPTYEYRCEKCKKTFDIFQSIKAEPLKKCPKCYSPVKRLVSKGVGFILKGSGFYATDYRSKNYKEKQSKDKGSVCPQTGKKADCSKCQEK